MADPPVADDAADERLMALLRPAVAHRSPEDVRVVAYTALSWRDPDAALAALVADSADPAQELESSVRGDGQPRLLAFANADVAIDVEVTEGSTVATLVGQLAPVGPADVAVDHPDGTAEATADELGRFRVEDVTRGAVRLRCTLMATGQPVHTEWTLL